MRRRKNNVNLVAVKSSESKTCPLLKGECLGSGCMAWRFSKAYVSERGLTNPSFDTHGFCGLAPLPEQE